MRWELGWPPTGHSLGEGNETGGRDLPSARVSLKEGGVELGRCSMDRAVMGAGAGSTYEVSLAELPLSGL